MQDMRVNVGVVIGQFYNRLRAGETALVAKMKAAWKVALGNIQATFYRVEVALARKVLVWAQSFPPPPVPKRDDYEEDSVPPPVPPRDTLTLTFSKDRNTLTAVVQVRPQIILRPLDATLKAAMEARRQFIKEDQEDLQIDIWSD